ncbi:MAG: right-handed parallel beta-helix repeat-containing protein [Ferruginibacter sp.]|nr:right-handed parallel beta-helix repeat-containing protein [Ferruginibacter sp.]
MRNLFIALLLLSANSTGWAQVWHVSGTGSDANNGKSPQTAFRSLQKAAELVQPGDLVLIGNGVYTNTDQSDGSAVLSITKSGTPDAWITWKAGPGSTPQIRPGGWSGIQITGSYHIIDGLTVIGGNDSITLLNAMNDAKKASPNPGYNTNGIFVEGRRKKPGEKPHHIIIRNCVIGKCGGGGIALIETDYITVEDCRVFENAWYMRYAGSGITTLNNWAFDDAPGYHIVIQRNFVWNNKSMVPWERTGKLSDGNGILLDVTDLARGGATNPNADAVVNPAGNPPAATGVATPEKPKRPEWKGRALIANNLSAYNGGSGIHVFRTKYVDIINNTTYWNGQTVGYQELFPNNSEDIVILNNVIVPRPGGKVTSNNRNTNIRWDYNLYPADQNVFKGTNDIVIDPHFIDIQPDPTKGNFRLAKDSRGLNSGSNDLAQPKDIIGMARPKGRGRDRGAFEQ